MANGVANLADSYVKLGRLNEANPTAHSIVKNKMRTPGVAMNKMEEVRT